MSREQRVSSSAEFGGLKRFDRVGDENPSFASTTSVFSETVSDVSPDNDAAAAADGPRRRVHLFSFWVCVDSFLYHFVYILFSSFHLNHLLCTGASL